MSYLLKTFRGINFNLEITEENLIQYRDELNNPALLTVPIAGIVMRKHNFNIIVQEGDVPDGDDVYDLYATDGHIYKIRIPDFDEREISARTNDRSIEFLIIGNALVNKNSIDLIIKANR